MGYPSSFGGGVTYAARLSNRALRYLCGHGTYSTNIVSLQNAADPLLRIYVFCHGSLMGGFKPAVGNQASTKP